jgi:hypothetical protein
MAFFRIVADFVKGGRRHSCARLFLLLWGGADWIDLRGAKFVGNGGCKNGALGKRKNKKGLRDARAVF